MWRWVLVALALVAFAAPAHAQDDGPGAFDEALSFFLFDAAHARSVLRSHGLEARADRLWTAAGEVAGALSDADSDAQPVFVPVLRGFRTAIADTVIEPGELDLAAVDALQAALDDQVRIQTAPGSDPAKEGVKVTVTAWRGGQKVGGYRVWMDLIGSIPRRGGTSNPLGQLVSPSVAYVAPGDYLIRLVDAHDHEVSRLPRKTIGNNGAEESVDMLIAP